jgi:hypothetical protein
MQDFICKAKEQRLLGRSERRWEDNTKMFPERNRVIELTGLSSSE